MICSGFKVLTYAVGDVVRVAPGHHCVNQSVASAVGEVFVPETQRSKIVGVVRK
jgi:hypothetical protein